MSFVRIAGQRRSAADVLGWDRWDNLGTVKGRLRWRVAAGGCPGYADTQRAGDHSIVVTPCPPPGVPHHNIGHVQA